MDNGYGLEPFCAGPGEFDASRELLCTIGRSLRRPSRLGVLVAAQRYLQRPERASITQTCLASGGIGRRS